jgi:hypothetical protein
MSTQNITITLSERELGTLISGLLFSCSVNVVSNTNEEYQRELFDLAKTLRAIKPDVVLDSIQFLQEENYEDSLSQDVLDEFSTNLEILTFENI